MTISGKSFLDLQSQREKLKEKTASNELSGGTATPPQPIQIKSSESQTVSDALKKQQINPAIIKTQNPTPGAVMTAADAPSQKDAQTAMKEILLEQKKKADAATKGMRADHTNPYSLAHYIQSVGNALFAGKTAFTTVGTQSTSEVEDKGELQLELDYDYAKRNIASTKEAKQKFSNIYRGNYTNTNFQVNKLGPKIGIQNGISNLGWMGNYQNKWITNDGSEAMMTNGKTTVSSPVIHIPDYKGELATAYDTVTYAAAQDGVVVTPEYLKQNFQGFADQPDNVVQNFIDDCLYDVQQGEKRPLEMYFDYYQGLSKADKYVNKQDSIMDALTDDSILNNSLGYFMEGQVEMEGRTPEEWNEYVNAVFTIKARANAINNEGFNETGAGDYILAKSFADSIPELKAAIDIYDKFDIKTGEILKIESQYNDAIQDQKDFVSKVDRSSIAEYNKMVRNYAHDYLDQFNRDYMNNWNAERLQGDLWYAGESPLQNWLWGKYYEKNGKWYDGDGNEIDPKEAEQQKAFINDYLEGLGQIARKTDQLGYDLQIASEGYDKLGEKYANVAFDSINLTFASLMNLTGAGVKFQAVMHLPIVGTIVESMFNFVMEDIFGNIAMGIADMTQFAQGWDKESVANYKEAMEGLGIMVLGGVKNRISKSKWRANKKTRFNDQAFIKAWKAATNKYVDGLLKTEVEPAKIQDLIREKNAQPKETAGTPKTRKEVEQSRKAEEKTTGKEAEGEKVEGEKTEGTKKPMFTTTLMKEAMSEFNRVFEEEYKKQTEGEAGTTIMDDLFNKARDLYSQITKERTVDIDAKLAELEKQATKTPETVEVKEAETVEPGKTEETVTVEEKTPETATQPTEETQVSETIETAPETPGVRVEEATTKAPETPEGVVESKENKAIQEKKTTINKILDFIQELQDTSVDVFNKIQNLYKKATEKSETKKIREREIQRQKDEQLLREAGLSNDEIDLVMNNPFGETLLDVINAMTKEITDKKGKIKEVQKDMDLKDNEIQREVLADGIKEIQEYVDKLVDMKNKLGKLYEELSTDRKIDTTDFATSEELANVLDGFKLELTEEIGEDLQIKTRVRKKGGGEMTAEQETIAKYVEAMIDNVIRRRSISEADAQAIRTKFDWKDDTVGSPSKAAKNSFRDAFNKFLDRQEGTDLLRKIDAGYSKISEAIKDLKEILTKDNQVKETAKNKILNWDEETLNQMEELVPGIKQLVELARKSPDIVKKGVTSKMKTKDTRRWLADPVRYTFVGLPTLVGATAGGVGGGVLGIILGSFIFKRSENLGGKLKGKIVKKAPDLKRFDAFVDNLSLSDKEKSAYKKEVLDNIDKIREKLQGEREAEFNEIMAEVNKIIIDRKAGDILDKLSDTEPTPPEGPDGTPPSDGTPPTGGAGEGEKITPMEKKIVEASLGKEEGETYSEKAETIANELLKLEKTVDDITTDYATEKLEERGEDVTPENIEKVKQEPEKEGDIMDFLRDMESDKQYTTDPTQPDYRKTDPDTLMEIIEHPEKYPNVDIEEVNDAINYILEKNAMAEMREGGGMRGSDINMEYMFAAEVDRVNGMEQRMADAKTPEAKENLKRERIKAKEDVIEEIQQAYNIDQFEAADKFDSLSNASLRTIEEGNRTKNGYKGKHRVSKAEQDKLLALMGKGPSQNITYTSTSDNIATLENPASRKRVAEQRIRQVVDPKLEKAKIGINKDKIARTTAKWQAEKEALENIIKQAEEQLKPQQEVLEQKKQIAEETKTLTEKRKNTRSREEKKELTKKIDENQDAFEKLTYEEAGELFSKPKEVEEMEAKEQGEKQEFDKAMDENETPQATNEQIDKETEGLEMEVEGYDTELGFGSPFVKVFKNGKQIGEYDLFHGAKGISETQAEWVRSNMYKPEYQKKKEETPKPEKLTTEERKQLNQINKEIEDSLFYKGGTDARGSMTDREKIEFTNTLEPHEEFYHASDTNIKEGTFDLSKTKDDPNGLGLAVSTSKDNPYGGKKHQYTINGKNMLIAKEGTTTSESNIRDISEILQIEPNAAWQYVPLAELTSIIRGEVEAKFGEANNADILKAFRDVTKYDGIDTSHGYTLLWNVDKINANAKKNKGGDKPEEPTTPKKPEPKEETYKERIDREFSETVDKLKNEKKQELTEKLNNGRFSKHDEYEIKVYRRDLKTQQEYSQPNIDKMLDKIKPEDIPEVMTNIAEFFERGYNIQLEAREGNRYTVYDIELGSADSTNIEGFKKRYSDHKLNSSKPKNTETKKEKGSEPLMKIENDGYVYNEPMPGDLKTEVIFERMEYIRKKAKETKKLTQKESAEFAKLKDLYKRQLEWEAREKQADMTDEELDDMYEKMYTHGTQSTAGIDVGQFVTD